MPYEVYAVRFATVPFRVSQLVAGADRERQVDIAFTLWAVRGSGRTILVDAGFYRDKFIQQWKPAATGGKHTFASQYVGVTTRSGIVVLASDNAYLYENLEQHLAIAQTLDAASNLAAQSRMLTLAASPRLVVPGHDPAVFQRFLVIRPGVVRID